MNQSFTRNTSKLLARDFYAPGTYIQYAREKTYKQNKPHVRLSLCFDFLFVVLFFYALQAERTAETARRSKRKAADDAASLDAATAVDTRSGSISDSVGGPGGGSSRELRVTQVGKKPAVCGTKTKAGDLIEFRCARELGSLGCFFCEPDVETS